MNTTVTTLANLYENAADTTVPAEVFETTLAQIDTLGRQDLNDLSALTGYRLRATVEGLRRTLRERIANRRGAALRCLMLGR
jgi:hypothetical protein